MSWLDEPVTPPTNFTSQGRINRVELIDHRAAEKPASRVYPETRGKKFEVHDAETVTLSIQDEGRTLKVFVS
jgi:hypothetical protein